MTHSTVPLTIIGGGLAGCEAAWQAAQRGIPVRLYEMRPETPTGAHTTPNLAELVCSNSLGSNLPDRASGVLKEELRRFSSLLLGCAEAAAIPAGGALAVDRDRFSRMVTEHITSHPNITVIRQHVADIPPTPAIIASGPLTSDALAKAIIRLTGQQRLFFYDAIAPVITAESIDMAIAFRASRYEKDVGENGDYLNCPFDKAQYRAFIQNLAAAQRFELKPFEQEIDGGLSTAQGNFFEGCLPVEVLAQRDEKALAFGPMRPVGLRDPHTGRRPYAVVQLRQEDLSASQFNLVGFQTNLITSEQKRVFRLIPGLQNAEFVRYGQMHRNTYLASPLLLLPTLQLRQRQDLFFAGQIAGVEGYIGNIATGLLAGINAARLLLGQTLVIMPESTLLGALCRHITQSPVKNFQPIKANFGILPPLDEPSRSKSERALQYRQRSLAALDGLNFLTAHESNGIK